MLVIWVVLTENILDSAIKFNLYYSMINQYFCKNKKFFVVLQRNHRLLLIDSFIFMNYAFTLHLYNSQY